MTFYDMTEKLPQSPHNAIIPDKPILIPLYPLHSLNTATLPLIHRIYGIPLLKQCPVIIIDNAIAGVCMIHVIVCPGDVTTLYWRGFRCPAFNLHVTVAKLTILTGNHPVRVTGSQAIHLTDTSRCSFHFATFSR
jgi:hypothetical protein